MKNTIVLFSLFLTNGLSAQMNTDIYRCTLTLSENGISADQPNNITKRKGYDNQPFFSNDGKKIYYSANYNGYTDIYFYDTESGKTFTVTNTPQTSEYSPMEMPDGKNISCVMVEKDTVTQRLWLINLKNRKEKLFSKENDSIGYYWPIENEWNKNEVVVSGTSMRKVVAEQEYAVFVLGTNEANHTLRIINPYRKLSKEKIIDDSVGRCIRQVPNDHFISYVKKTSNGNYLKFYDLHKRAITGSFFMGRDNEDYCWKGKMLIFSNGSTLVAVRFDKGYDKPSVFGQIDFSKYSIENIKRISCFENKIAFVADDQK